MPTPVKFTLSVEMESRVCPTCGVVYALPERIVEQRNKDGQKWYCPNGHQLGFGADKFAEMERQYNTAATESVRLAKKLRDAEAKIGRLESQLLEYEEGPKPKEEKPAEAPRPEAGLKELPRPARPKTGMAAPSPEVEERRKKIVAYLAVNQPKFAWKIAKECGLKPTWVSYALKHPWFKAVQSGYALTPAGEAQAVAQGVKKAEAPKEQPKEEKKPAAQPEPNGQDKDAERREALVREIARNGPATTEDIAVTLDVAVPVAAALLRHPWFGQDGDEWVLTDKARAESKTLNSR
jgi:hypothetical protein